MLMTRTIKREKRKTIAKMNKVIFGALILSHGRSDNVITFDTLRKFGYTGDIKIVVDNEDKTIALYQEKFGKENVIIFDKKAVPDTFDEGDNFQDRRAIIYARNASFKIAEALGWTHFIQLDDDYTDWRWSFGSDRKYHHIPIVSLDRVFNCLVNFLDSTPTLTIALAQGGDFIGGQNSSTSKSINLGQKKRKAMNTFVCRVDRPIGFVGRINEDVNTYVRKGMVGELFFATNCARITQRMTQSNKGGMTDLYKDSGTYIKSFYTIMYAPSCVKVKPFITKHQRFHHQISWRHAIPKILREEVKK